MIGVLTIKQIAKGKSIALMLMLCIATLMLGARGVLADWTPYELVSTETQISGNDTPSLDVGPDGTVHIAWVTGVRDIVYKRYEPGVGWTTTEEVSPPTGFQPSLDVGPDGTVHIAWVYYTVVGGVPHYDIWYKRYEPGVGWTTAEEVSTNSEQPSLDVGPDGTVHIAWVTRTGDIVYKRYEPGVGWTTAEVVSPLGSILVGLRGPSLDVGPDGAVHIAYILSLGFPDYDVVYKRYEPGVGWTTAEVVASAHTVVTGTTGPYLGVGPDGTVHIAWTDYVSPNFWVLYKRYEPGVGWTTAEVVSPWPTGGRVRDVDVGSDGTAYILWQSLGAYYRSYVPGIGWTAEEVAAQDAGAFEILWPTMAVGPDGNVHFAWDTTYGYGIRPEDGRRNIYYRRFEVAPPPVVVNVAANDPNGFFTVTINAGTDKGVPVTSWTEIGTTNIASYTVTLIGGDMVMVIDGQLLDPNLGGQIVLDVDPVGVIITYQINIAPFVVPVVPTIESSDSTGTKKDSFLPGDTVYAYGSDYSPSTTYNIYIVNDVVTWSDGMAIPTWVPGTATTVTSDASGNIPPSAAWGPPLTLGKYDIIVDVNGNGVYNAGIDALDDSDIEVTAGFNVVPEVPFGTAMTFLSMLIALVGFVGYKRFRPKFRPQ